MVFFPHLPPNTSPPCSLSLPLPLLSLRQLNPAACRRNWDLQKERELHAFQKILTAARVRRERERERKIIWQIPYSEGNADRKWGAFVLGTKFVCRSLLFEDFFGGYQIFVIVFQDPGAEFSLCFPKERDSWKRKVGVATAYSVVSYLYILLSDQFWHEFDILF